MPPHSFQLTPCRHEWHDSVLIRLFKGYIFTGRNVQIVGTRLITWPSILTASYQWKGMKCNPLHHHYYYLNKQTTTQKIPQWFSVSHAKLCTIPKFWIRFVWISALIRLYLQESGITDSHFHNENLMITVLNLFAAGTDTTATTLRWALLFMAKYPKIQGKELKTLSTVQTIICALPTQKSSSGKQILFILQTRWGRSWTGW